MTNSFLILVTTPFRCTLKRKGEEAVRLCSNPDEALAAIRRILEGAPGEAKIVDQATGESRVVRLDRSKSKI